MIFWRDLEPVGARRDIAGRMKRDRARLSVLACAFDQAATFARKSLTRLIFDPRPQIGRQQ